MANPVLTVALHWTKGMIQDFYSGHSLFFLFTSQLSPFFPVPSQAPWEVASSPSLEIFKTQLYKGLGNAISLWRRAHFERCLDKRLPEMSFSLRFSKLSTVFRNTQCRLCTIPFSPKTCWQFCVCRNGKLPLFVLFGFVQDCITGKPRIFITQNLHRKSVLVDDVPESVPESHNAHEQSHDHSPGTADTPVLRNLLLRPAALSGCSANTSKD